MPDSIDPQAGSVPADVDAKVRGVTNTGAPVPERISSVQAARSVCDRIITNNDQESKRRTRIKGMIDGNPPWDPRELEELGLGYKTNVNLLEMRSMLDVKASAFHELLHEVPALIELVPVKQDKDRQVHTWARVVAEEFTVVMQDWPGFYVNMDRVRRDADAYGMGAQAWPDEFDYRSEAVQLLVDPDASLDISRLQIAVFRRELLLSDLVARVNDAETSSAAGWDVTKIKDVLISRFGPKSAGASTGDQATTRPTWEIVQERIRNNDPDIQASEFQGVKCLQLLVAELDGRVSHYIFTDTPVMDVSGSTADAFLFRRVGRFGSMQQALWWLPYNYGEGTVRSVRGVASYLEPHCDLSNRYFGQIVDSAFVSASLILQPKTAIDMTQLQLIRVGVTTIIPPELSAVQSSFAPSFQHLISVRGVSNDIMKNNAGVYRQHPEVMGERQAEKTARQVAEESSKEARVEKASLTHDYTLLDAYFREVFRRLTAPSYTRSETKYGGADDARRFVERCEARGVPREVMDQAASWFRVYAARAIGMGSWGVKMDVTGQIMSIRGLLDEAGKNEAVREYLSVRVGPRNVDRFRPRISRDQIPGDAVSMAVLENNDMREGSQVEVGVDQLHKLHVVKHMELGDLLAQAWQTQQADPRQIYASLIALIPHVIRHAELMSIDPAHKDFIAELKPMVDKLDELRRDVEAAVKALAKEEQLRAREAAKQKEELDAAQMEFERRRGEDEVSAKYELERRKQDSLNQARLEKTLAQLDIRRRESEARLQLEQERQDAEIRMREERGG